jgi:hypothetical protein
LVPHFEQRIDAPANVSTAGGSIADMFEPLIEILFEKCGLSSDFLKARHPNG